MSSPASSPAWSSASLCGSGSSATSAGRCSARACRRGWRLPTGRAIRPGPRRRPGSWRSTRHATTSRRPTSRQLHHEHDLGPAPDARDGPVDARSAGRRRVLAALAIFLVLVTVYQTLVLTVVTDDVIRKGIEADEYDMIWVNVAWGVAVLYSIFGAFCLAARYGMRITLAWGLVFF